MTLFSLLPPLTQLIIIALLVTFGAFCLVTVIRAVFYKDKP